MDGWMNGWANGQMEEWTDEWVGKWQMNEKFRETKNDPQGNTLMVSDLSSIKACS